MRRQSAKVAIRDSIADHPMLLLGPLAIGLFVSALLSDLAYWVSFDSTWAQVSLWLIGGGLLITTLLAASGHITGFVASCCAPPPIQWLQLLGYGLVLLLSLFSFLVRIEMPIMDVPSVGLCISVITVAILLAIGWVGEELAYQLGRIKDSPWAVAVLRATRQLFFRKWKDRSEHRNRHSF